MESLTDPQLKTVLAHEVMHCALLHVYRRGDRDLREFNIAADYAINNFLERVNQDNKSHNREAPFVFDGPLANGCIDHAYDHLSAEEIYTLRMGQKPPQQDGGKPGGQPGDGESGDSDSESDGQPGDKPGQDKGKAAPKPASSPGEFTDGAADEAERDEAQAQWKIATMNAAEAAKQQGRLPACAARFVKDLLHPKVPWQEVLRQFLTATTKNDYSFAQPNRRYGGGCILPGLHSPRLGKIVVAVDTSGSIGQREFSEFMSEVQNILFNCQPEELILAQCDCRLTEWRALDPFEDITAIALKGGGGTDFCPVFERAEEEATPPAALIYLTDMMGEFPAHEPAYAVLWARTTKAAAPWGITVDVE